MSIKAKIFRDRFMRVKRLYNEYSNLSRMIQANEKYRQIEYDKGDQRNEAFVKGSTMVIDGLNKQSIQIEVKLNRLLPEDE